SLPLSVHHRYHHSFPTRRSSDLVVLLIITILGIPLLLLIPFAVLAVLIVFLIGFTGVAARVGQFIGPRLGWTNTGPYLTTILGIDRKSTRLNSSHVAISYAVFCL